MQVGLHECDRSARRRVHAHLPERPHENPFRASGAMDSMRIFYFRRLRKTAAETETEEELMKRGPLRE